MPAAYADSSVIVAAFAPDEPAHASAKRWLTGEDPAIVTSVVTEVEVTRALQRREIPAGVRADAARLLARVTNVEITAEIRQLALQIRPASLRTIDAIHVGTALLAGVSRFATLDLRQRVAAEEMGLALVDF